MVSPTPATKPAACCSSSCFDSNLEAYPAVYNKICLLTGINCSCSVVANCCFSAFFGVLINKDSLLKKDSGGATSPGSLYIER